MIFWAALYMALMMCVTTATVMRRVFGMPNTAFHNSAHDMRAAIQSGSG